MKLMIKVKKPADEYEIRELTRLFLPEQDFMVVSTDGMDEHSALVIQTEFQYEKTETKLVIHSFGRISLTWSFTIQTVTDQRKQRKNEKNLLKRSIFDLLQSWYPRWLPWGILTGVRPVKIAHEALRREADPSKAIRHIQEETLMAEEKAALMTEVACRQREYLGELNPKAVSLYINIPLCPTKCSYCSFASQSIKSQDDSILQDYLQGLLREMETVFRMLKEKELPIQSLYIGGGTPSVLSAKQLKQFFSKLSELWDLHAIEEITFEGGRPDTLSKEKLSLLSDYPVHRISINPQTLHDRTLQTINRRHTVQDFFSAYEDAVKTGLININVDLIMGLPGESPEDFQRTLNKLARLDLKSLTVHSLAMKRTAGLKQQHYRFEWEDHHARSVMQLVYEFAKSQNLEAYYLYRQKQMLANMENVGFAKPGKASLYNILMMEEKQTVLGIGAGAVSKLVYPLENRVQRIPGIKDLKIYLERMPVHHEKWRRVFEQL